MTTFEIGFPESKIHRSSPHHPPPYPIQPLLPFESFSELPYSQSPMILSIHTRDSHSYLRRTPGSSIAASSIAITTITRATSRATDPPTRKSQQPKCACVSETQQLRTVNTQSLPSFSRLVD